MKYPALMEVFKEDIEKKIEEGIEERVRRAEKEAEEKVKERANERLSIAEAAKEQETKLIDIKNIMANLKLTFDQAMDALNIPQAQWDTYAGLVEKKP